MRESGAGSRDRDMEIQAIFPDVDLSKPLSFVSNGFRSVVVVDAGDVIYRLSRSLEAAHLHSVEVHLLDALAPRLPVAIPEAEYRPGHGFFPFSAMRYPRLPGVPLQREMLRHLNKELLASEIVLLLIALRVVPLESLDGLSLPEPSDARASRIALREATLPALAEVLSAGELEIVESWWHGFLTDGALIEFTPTLIHSDLWYENVLVDPETGIITGVLDWEDAAIGDQSQDVAALLHLGPAVVERVLVGLRRCDLLDATFEYRVRRHWEMRELVGIKHALSLGDRDEFLDAVRKLRAGPLFGVRSEKSASERDQ